MLSLSYIPDGAHPVIPLNCPCVLMPCLMKLFSICQLISLFSTWKKLIYLFSHSLWFPNSLLFTSLCCQFYFTYYLQLPSDDPLNRGYIVVGFWTTLMAGLYHFTMWWRNLLVVIASKFSYSLCPQCMPPFDCLIENLLILISICFHPFHTSFVHLYLRFPPCYSASKCKF